MKVLTNKMASIPLKGETRMMPAFDPASVLPGDLLSSQCNVRFIVDELISMWGTF